MGVRPTKFPKGHPIVESLPAVNPALGITPDGITINGVWDVATQTAKLTFDASTSGDVVKYELRICAGPNDNTDVESVVTNLPPDAPREFSTNIGLFTTGNIASFKVYVITTTGNEKGSNAVSITHP